MIKEDLLKKQKKLQRQRRVRVKLAAVRDGKPRLSVFASNKYFYAQIIDDTKGVTLVAVSEKELKKSDKMTKIQRAEEVGKLLAQKAKTGKIPTVVFDKGSYKYHGRVKAFAESARQEGLQF